MANALSKNIAGCRVKVAGAGNRIFKINEGADAGFGSFNFTAGHAVYGHWEDGPDDTIDGSDVLEIVEDKP